MPDGKHIVYSSGAVYLLSSESGKTETLLPSGDFACLSPDGATLGYIADNNKSYNYELWTATIKGEQPRQITKMQSYMTFPRFLPHSKTLWVLSDVQREKRYEIWEVSMDGKGPKKIAGSDLFANPMTWRPKEP